MSLGELCDTLRSSEATHLPDAIVPLASLAYAANDTVVVPDRGEHKLTNWSRSQLSTLVGVRWDRWFSSASAQERAEELTRRLQRARGNVRLRLGLQGDHQVLRAVVSPWYEPVLDSLMLRVIERVLGPMASDVSISRMAVTDRSTTCVLTLGGPQHGGRVVGELLGGVLFKNSDVGWSALSIGFHIVRLVCKNGMVAPIGDGTIVRVRHRSIDVPELEGQLIQGLRSLPEALLRSRDVLVRSLDRGVRDVEAAARGVLREVGMVRRHLPGVMRAFKNEPLPSAFGVSQAITLAAQGFDVSAEDRLELESIAGRYVAGSDEN